MEVKCNTTIVQIGNNTGIHVPENILEQLKEGKKPLVKVTLNAYTYRSAVGKMNGKFLISLSAENRKNANVNEGDNLDVIIALDTEPRVVELPIEVLEVLENNKIAKATFETMAPSKKKAIALSISDTKTQETKTKRIEKALIELNQIQTKKKF